MSNKITLNIRTNASISEILCVFCDEVDAVPTQETKAFFREWEGRVPYKLLNQCLFAGAYWAHAHPDRITFEETNDQD